MIGVIARKLFGSSNERRIKGYLPRVAQINALEKELAGLSDDALRARTEEFKRQVAGGTSLELEHLAFFENLPQHKEKKNMGDDDNTPKEIMIYVWRRIANQVP